MKLLLAFALPLLAAAQDAPKIFYSKSFPASRPPYMEIRLDRNGHAEYREGPDESNPIVLKLTPDEVDAVFALADKLNHFSKELESGLKVARMGDKLLRWESGSEKHEVKFNYSIDLDAEAIHDWFERMCEASMFYINLERVAKYDKLGVNLAILQLEAAYDRKRLVSLSTYLPLLDRIAKNESYMNMARDRADKLATTFRTPPPANAKPAAQK